MSAVSVLGNCYETRSIHAGTDVLSSPNYRLNFNVDSNGRCNQYLGLARDLINQSKTVIPSNDSIHSLMEYVGESITSIP